MGQFVDVTSRCRFVVEPEGVASVEPAASSCRGPTAGPWCGPFLRIGPPVPAVQVERASDWDARAELSDRRRPAPLQGRLQHGGVPRQPERQGGFRLSLRGDDPAFDHRSLTHDQLGRRLNRIAPQQQPDRAQTDGRVPHEGGLRFTSRLARRRGPCSAGSARGAAMIAPSLPRVKRLRVFPAERILAPGAVEQQLVVTAEFDDGTTRDVTRQASYDVSDPTRASSLGRRPGALRGPAARRRSPFAIMNGRATSRLAFLADRPGFVWRGPPANGPIDTLVFAKLKALRINPSPVGGDSVFLRQGLPRRDRPAPRAR